MWDGSAVGSSKPKPILSFPDGVNPTGLQYQRDTGALVFSGQVWADGDLTSSGKGDEAWEGRGTSGVVFDELFIRYVDGDGCHVRPMGGRAAWAGERHERTKRSSALIPRRSVRLALLAALAHRTIHVTR